MFYIYLVKSTGVLVGVKNKLDLKTSTKKRRKTIRVEILNLKKEEHLFFFVRMFLKYIHEYI